MKPLDGKDGEPQALIFIQGADCKQSQYVDHLKAVQEKVSFPLWIAIPKFIDDKAIPEGTSIFINKGIKDLQKAMGDDKVDQFFYGGHSLGGSTAASYVQKTADNAIATFAWGAYTSIAIENPVKDFKTPFLTVGAELDGWLARITRIAESFDKMNNTKIDVVEARY